VYKNGKNVNKQGQARCRKSGEKRGKTEGKTNSTPENSVQTFYGTFGLFSAAAAHTKTLL